MGRDKEGVKNKNFYVSSRDVRIVCPWLYGHSTYVTAGGSGYDIIHVSSVITPTLRSENVQLHCNHQVHREFLITLYMLHINAIWITV